MIVTYQHLKTIPSRRGNGYCNRDARPWFKSHGICWNDFVKHGIDHEVLTATGDGMALALVAWAAKCEASDDGR